MKWHAKPHISKHKDGWLADIHVDGWGHVQAVMPSPTLAYQHSIGCLVRTFSRKVAERKQEIIDSSRKQLGLIE